jgi:hypothetical protein
MAVGLCAKFRPVILAADLVGGFPAQGTINLDMFIV